MAQENSGLSLDQALDAAWQMKDSFDKFRPEAFVKIHEVLEAAVLARDHISGLKATEQKARDDLAELGSSMAIVKGQVASLNAEKVALEKAISDLKAELRDIRAKFAKLAGNI